MWSPNADVFAAAIAFPGELMWSRPQSMMEVNMQDLVQTPVSAEAQCGKVRFRAWTICSGIALGACLGLSGAPAEQPKVALSMAADEAVGSPGVDPYAFYVFNRQDGVNQRPSPLPAVVCLCLDEPLRQAAMPPPAVVTAPRAR
jgi:hypothetical protein